MRNLLSGTEGSWFKIAPGEAALYAGLGFLIVVAGIALLIAIFTVAGAISSKLQGRKRSGKSETVVRESVVSPPDEIEPEVVAAIAAALAAYMEEQPQRCEFVVKRIKRL